MKITWYGHAAFLIETGTSRIILDPYTSTCGFDPIDDSADIVMISHENEKYHSGLSELKGNFKLIDGLKLAESDSLEQSGITFSACEVYEDTDQNGPNAMLKLASEGLTVAHLGDLGHRLNETQKDFLKGTDILLALAGGMPTLSMPDLMDIINDINPSIIIPMHFKIGKLDLPIHDDNKLLAYFDENSVIRLNDSSIELLRLNLPDEPIVVRLDPAR